MEEKISGLLAKRFEEEDLKDCFLVDLKMGLNKKIEVFVDSDEGIGFEKCRVISRYLESHFDNEQWFGENYILEVSSPGTSRPLSLKRQYPKHIGRKLEVKLKSDGKEEGTLVSVSEKGIELERKERIKEGKRKKTVVKHIEIGFDDIDQSIVKISFKNK